MGLRNAIHGSQPGASESPGRNGMSAWISPFWAAGFWMEGSERRVALRHDRQNSQDGVHERLGSSLAEGGSEAVKSQKGRELDTRCSQGELDTQTTKCQSHKHLLLMAV